MAGKRKPSAGTASSHRVPSAAVGPAPVLATVTIRNKTLEVRRGHHGTPQLRVRADGRAWLRFLGKDQNLATALLTRRIRLSGDPRLLARFGRCFPS